MRFTFSFIYKIEYSNIMNFKDLMEKRYSARDFTSKEIAESDLCEIIEISELSPSWANTQPWNVYIATGESLNKIREKWIEQNTAEIEGNSDLPTGHREDFGKRGLNNRDQFFGEALEVVGNPEDFAKTQHVLFNSTAIVYLTIPKGSPMWSVYDLGAFSMSLMLAASEKDIDSIPAYELIKYHEVLRENLPIPESEDIIAGIALGYASDAKINEFRSSRLDVNDILKIIK